MSLDFENFLNSSEKNCKTKNDFLKRIKSESRYVNESGNEFNPLDRELYLRRLDNAKFCIEKGAFKIKDAFNNMILNLLDKLK